MADPLISIVVAMARNGIIGRDGDMPWRLSADLKRFKALTLGKPIIMGRKTFESIGKALPGRTNIIVTRNRDWQVQGTVPVANFDQAISLAVECPGGDEEICIVGGGEIYRQALDQADILHVTHVDAEPEGDTRFPQIDSAAWTLVSDEHIPLGEKDSAATRYAVYKRSQARES